MMNVEEENTLFMSCMDLVQVRGVWNVVDERTKGVLILGLVL